MDDAVPVPGQPDGQRDYPATCRFRVEPPGCGGDVRVFTWPTVGMVARVGSLAGLAAVVSRWVSGLNE
jgi:hypothetical protein